MNKIHTMIHRLHNPDFAILLVRITLALTFVHAGWLKLQNMETVITGFGQVGLVPIFAYLVSISELVGGIAMLVGIFVRYFGIILAFIMFMAIIIAHGANGYGIQNGGYEYVLALLLVSISTVLSGAGKYSFARWYKERKARQESLF